MTLVVRRHHRRGSYWTVTVFASRSW